MNDRPLRVGIVCYGRFGGSGIMATEIGLALAERGHSVHFLSKDVPRRYDRRVDGVFFHGVEARDHPVLEHPLYTLALASRIADVARWESLDLVHAHYAVPHAAALFLAGAALGEAAPKAVLTLHGTDVTEVGSDPSYRPVTRFAIEAMDGVTVPSEHLRREAAARFDLAAGFDLRVLPNFVDTAAFAPAAGDGGRCLARLFGSEEPAFAIVHVSNFRPVKRTGDVAAVFERVAREVPARLVLIGDGPDRQAVETRLRDAGLGDRVRFLGMQEHFADLLARADVFLLPSAEESFGLAALEAQSCGVPVVASETGGLPGVVRDGETGLLAPPGDVEAFAAAVLRVAKDPALHAAMRRAARAHVLASFRKEDVMDRYEAFYREVLARPPKG